MKLNDINNAVLVWGVVSDEGMKRLKEQNCIVIVAENRPYLIGLKHNIPLLKKEKVNFVYCTDNMLGLLFYKGKIKKTFVFCKQRKEENIGICGSLYVCLLSSLHNVQVEIVPQAEVDFEGLDRDVSSLGARGFVLEEYKQGCIIEADDEVLTMPDLRGEKC